MNIDHEGNVWCPYCWKWVSPRSQLWIPDDNGTINIVCIEAYPEKWIHLGYDSDLKL